MRGGVGGLCLMVFSCSCDSEIRAQVFGIGLDFVLVAVLGLAADAGSPIQSGLSLIHAGKR